MTTLPSNLTLDYDISKEPLATRIVMGRETANTHFTNGTYAAPADLIVPTLLAGFRFITDRFAVDTDDSLAVAINSDSSMFHIYNALATKAVEEAFMALMQTNNPDHYQAIPAAEWADRLSDFRRSDQGEAVFRQVKDAKMKTHQEEAQRAKKIAIPLALEHPRRRVQICFYHEATPHDLYEHLSQTQGLRLISLHKWDYGIDPKGPKIEGAEFFENVIGTPLPKDADKPLCHDITVKENQTRKVQIFNLMTEEKGPSGTHYLTRNGKVAYPLTDQRNAKFAPAP